MQLKFDREKHLKWGLIGLAYFAGAWLSLSLIGYGFALNQFDQTKRRGAGTSDEGIIVERSSFGWGYLGNICFNFGPSRANWCIKHDYIDSKQYSAGEIYRMLSPGTRVGLKGVSGYVMELWLPPSKAVINYNIAAVRVNEDMRSGEGGIWMILLGLAILPLVVLVHQRRRLLDRLT